MQFLYVVSLKFHSLPWRVTVNSTGDSQLKEMELCYSEYQIYDYYFLALFNLSVNNSLLNY